MDFLKNNWYILLAIAFLIGSFGDWTYSYYQILRWAVTGVAIYVAYTNYKLGKQKWTWIFGITAIIFNPLFPFYFERETWEILDVVAVALFTFFLFKKRKYEISS